MIKVGNQTNSQDPQAVNSRVFVGNLNTFQASKSDVEKLFQRYGRIAGISMHKGFAFVQFTNGFDARSACIGEDERYIFGQTLDVNMVSEPKQVLAVKKQQQQQKYSAGQNGSAASQQSSVNNNNNERTADFIGDSDGDVVGVDSRCCCGHSDSSAISPHNQQLTDSAHFCLDNVKTYSSPDILICGDCRELFGDVMDMIEHKQSTCKLRFVCKCDEIESGSGERHGQMTCSLCMAVFSSAWDMMVHFQSAHTVNIYRLSNSHKEVKSTARDVTRSEMTPTLV